MDESLPRHAVEPESVIAEAVCAIEPDLDQGLVENVVTDTFRYSPQRRQLALLQQQPVSLLAWLTRRPGRATVLHALAAGHGPVTHNTLDQLRPTKVVENLRMHLVVGGALPPRDGRLSTFERWLPGKIAQVDVPESRKVLHAYATWHLLRRLRTVSRRRLTHGQVHGARAYVTQVIQLLNWLSSQNIPLSACSQDLIDAWLDENPARGPRVQGFLVWTGRKGHTRQLAVPLGTPAFTGQLIAQDARWSLVSRLIHDEEIPIVDKTTGLLALLFAQQPHRIAELTTDDVHVTADAVALRLGGFPAQLPPPLDELLLALHADAMAGSTAAERWLFPGRYPGRPLSRSQVMRRLHALGIRPRMARSTVLVEPASELPAVVVSRLLGVHQTTADTWKRIGGQDNTYAAEIAQRG